MQYFSRNLSRINILQTRNPCKLMIPLDLRTKYPQGGGGGVQNLKHNGHRENEEQQRTTKKPQAPQKHHKMHSQQRMVQQLFAQRPLHFRPMRFTIEA